jgi:methylated-DNA-[protein]-cysteine S-methyltransferase
MLVRTIIDSPTGPLLLVASDDGLRCVQWPGEHLPRDVTEAVEQPEHPVLVRARAQLDEYFAGTRQEFDLPLDPQGTEFQRQAWAALRTIRYGETVSYAEQARRLGDVRKTRAVGAANGRNPIAIIVPCHRVVGADGTLTGFAGGLPTKAFLLDLEARVSRAG